MRAAAIARVGLVMAGCAEPAPPPPLTDADRARFDRQAAEFWARTDASERNQQARAICAARGQLREQAQPYRGVLNLDNVIAGSHAARVCWETYVATGIMPT